ncbi:MAG: hypothetical protein M3Y82_05345, partial [Verrucomicrobiota bacterium]|nr:hypothetical protein [Verrucomicrobiota bacterium]
TKFKDALKSNSQTAIETALEKLAPCFEQHPEKINEMVSWLKNEENVFDLLSMLREANMEHSSPSAKDIIIKLSLEIVQMDNLFEKRSAALSQLTKAFDVTNEVMTSTADIAPPVIDSVMNLVNNDPDKRIRLAAIETIDHWIDRNPNILSSLGEKLLQSAKASDDAEFRFEALQTIVNSANRHMGFSEDALLQLTDILWKDPDARNRALAVQGFTGASGLAINSALTQLETAYYEQRDQNTRSLILHQMAAIGKTEAISLLQKIPETDPLLSEAQTLLQTLKIKEGSLTDNTQ